MNTVHPCVHPGCQDSDGNPRLTTQTMCDPCRWQLRRDLDWIVLDYVVLKSTLPTPARRSGPGAHHSAQQSFGHPAADASAAVSEIAWLLNNLEAQLRAHGGDRPAPDLTRTCEPALVSHAYTYLSAHFDQLTCWPEVGHHAGALHDTHQTNRAVYGLTRRVDRLPVPCPSCDVAALVRDEPPITSATPGARDDTADGGITCDACGRVIAERDYPVIARMTIAWQLHVYEAELSAAALQDTGD